MALWTLFCVDQDSMVTVGREGGFAWIALSAVPGSPYPRETCSKMSAPSPVTNKSEKIMLHLIIAWEMCYISNVIILDCIFFLKCLLH